MLENQEILKVMKIVSVLQESYANNCYAAVIGNSYLSMIVIKYCYVDIAG